MRYCKPALFLMIIWAFCAQLFGESLDPAEGEPQTTRGVDLSFINWTNYDGRNMPHEEGGRELFLVWEGGNIYDSPQYTERLATEDGVMIRSTNIPLPFAGPFDLLFPVTVYRWKNETKLKVAEFTHTAHIAGSFSNFRPEIALVADYTENHVDLYLYNLDTEKFVWVGAVCKELW